MTTEHQDDQRRSGGFREAVNELFGRNERDPRDTSQLDVRELRPEERDGFAASWTRIQQGFVDDPVQSVHEADALVVEIMRTRGYPVDDFDRRAEDVSVEHPQVAAKYREAREIRLATESGTADTEQQRHAVTSYRELIEALLGHGSHDDTKPAAEPQTNGRHAHTTTEEHTR